MPTPRSTPSTWASLWALAWPGNVLGPVKSGSATAAGVSTIASRANSPAAPARRDRYGCTSTEASSYWTFPQPPRRSCHSDRTHDPTAQAQVTFSWLRMFPGVVERLTQATCDIPRGWLQAQEEVVRVVFVAGVQDIPGGDLQGIVPGACHRAAGSHLVAAGDPALLSGVLLERGSYAAAA